MNRILLYSIAVLFTAVASCRAEDMLYGTIAGRDDDTTRILSAATIHWIGKPDRGTLSDKGGRFRLSRKGIDDERIVARFFGYKPDTLSVSGMDSVAIVLATPIELGNIVVEGSKEDSEIMTSPMRTDVITGAQIAKDACCDLSGCFNTSGAVEANVTDFVTDKRELQILGMSGVYNQVLIDGMPMLMTGLNSGYGLNLIPGPFIRRISVVKGANSVLQGDESLTGIVDVRIKDPKDINGAYGNLFVNAHMEKQLNLAYAGQISDSWGVLAAGHVALPSMRIDEGGDSFLDMPLTTRYTVFSKLKYEQVPTGDSGLVSTFFVKYTNEERTGGSREFEAHHDLGGTNHYGQTVMTDRVEGYAHLVEILRAPQTGARSTLSLSVAGALHRQHSYFGTTRYDADQKTLYADLRAQTEPSPSFLVRSGIDYRLENIDETIDLGANPLGKTYGGSYEFSQWSIGPYTEFVWTLFDKSLVLMPGARMEYGNSLDRQGIMSILPEFSTRIFALYRPDELTSLRASIGTGSRPVRLWSENSTVLAGGRNIPLAPAMSQLSENGVNYGAGIARIFDIEGMLTTVSLDYYRTVLWDQLYFDYESGTNLVLTSGSGRSQSVQAEVDVSLSEEWHTKLTYNYLEALRDEHGVQKQVPFTSRHKVLATLSFAPRQLPWMFDANLHWYGKQRLPSTAMLPVEYRRPEYSDPYALLNAQVTYRWQQLDIYGGVENLLNFTQNDPVIDPAHPFGQHFDTSFIWGPVKGREFYAGIRYTLQMR